MLVMEERPPALCAVTNSFLKAVSALYPEHLQSPCGGTYIGKTLHLLGFAIDKQFPDESYVTLEDAMIRNVAHPYMINMKETLYSGRVRNMIDDNGKAIKNTPHWMNLTYMKYEVLSLPSDIEYCEDINTIGTNEYYLKGMHNLNKRVDSSKKQRVIVRS